MHCQAEISHKDVTLTSANFHISLPLLLARELPRHRRIFKDRNPLERHQTETTHWLSSLKKIFINRNKFLNLVAVATESEGILGNGPLIDVCIFSGQFIPDASPNTFIWAGIRNLQTSPRTKKQTDQVTSDTVKKKFSVV